MRIRWPPSGENVSDCRQVGGPPSWTARTVKHKDRRCRARCGPPRNRPPKEEFYLAGITPAPPGSSLAM
jgi:hypothetical protein